MAVPDGVLTEKQEMFAQVYVQTANAAEAYRAAYDVAESARDSWIYVEAAQLLEHPKIAPRIKELREKAKERAEYSVFQALDELEEARTVAINEAQAAAAVSAVNGKVKLLGLDAPTRSRHEVTGKNGGPIQTEELSARDILANKLAGIASRAGTGKDAGGAD